MSIKSIDDLILRQYTETQLPVSEISQTNILKQHFGTNKKNPSKRNLPRPGSSFLNRRLNGKERKERSPGPSIQDCDEGEADSTSTVSVKTRLLSRPKRVYSSLKNWRQIGRSEESIVSEDIPTTESTINSTILHYHSISAVEPVSTTIDSSYKTQDQVKIISTEEDIFECTHNPILERIEASSEDQSLEEDSYMDSCVSIDNTDTEAQLDPSIEATTAEDQHQYQTTTMPSAPVRFMRLLMYNPLTYLMLRVPTAADSLPTIPSLVLENSKTSFCTMMASCFVLDAFFILPGYATSILITEYGVYASTLLFIWLVGRFILRLIAFPGSTVKVYGEIENEFSKYSVRMLENATEHITSLCRLLLSIEDVSLYSISSDDSSVGAKERREKLSKLIGLNYDDHDIIMLWRKVCSYRSRVLGMYCSVLKCLLTEGGIGVLPQNAGDQAFLSKKYGNNRMVGDIGNLSTNSTKAKNDGKKLYKCLSQVLEDLDFLEREASSFLKSSGSNKPLSKQASRAAQKLLSSSLELSELLPFLHFRPSSSSNQGSGNGRQAEDESQRSSSESNDVSVSGVKSTVLSIIQLFDPPVHNSIFGLDMLRGTMLSRYKGARQLWVPRPKHEGGGMLDVIHIPSSTRDIMSSTSIEKAVLFCNPNAGLLEAATGLSLIGGNVVTDSARTASCWAEYYTERGFDIFLFNYSGFGRSFVGKRRKKDVSEGAFHCLKRIMCQAILGFKPTPSSLKADALAMAIHISNEIGVKHLIIHGESIGGMAASSAAQSMSEMKKSDEDVTSIPVSQPTLLICDRTFCNLNAVAQHLVGHWTGVIIPLLIPFWNTDVAGHFAAARCKKIVAQDAGDAIIHDSSSLKSGLATAHEMHQGITKGVCSLSSTLLQYRITDWENVGVYGSKIVKGPDLIMQPPKWPVDKRISVPEALHFAACARRIGKAATNVLRHDLHLNSSYEGGEEEEGIEITQIFSRESVDTSCSVEDPPVNSILVLWEVLSRLDGLTGMPLGIAVKEGHDCVVSWLSCIAIFGAQRVALNAAKRCCKKSSINSSDVCVEESDFAAAITSHKTDDEEQVESLLSLPHVIQKLKQAHQEKDGMKDGKQYFVFYVI